MPEQIVNPTHFPGYAHKESLIELETADDIEKYIDATGFCTKTKHNLKLLLSSASGKEYRTANFSKWEALDQLAEYNIGLIELEVLAPREDREKQPFNAAVRAIRKLYIDNLSQCTRDEYGRNVFLFQYIEAMETHSYSEVNEKSHVTQLMPQQPGSLLKNIPIIGGFIK